MMLNNRKVCPICFDVIEDDCSLLNCNHIYHSKCINIWLKDNNTCPICRSIVNNKFYVKLNSNYLNIKDSLYLAVISNNYILFRHNNYRFSIPIFYIEYIYVNLRKNIVKIKDKRIYKYEKKKFCINYTKCKNIKYSFKFLKKNQLHHFIECLQHNNLITNLG